MTGQKLKNNSDIKNLTDKEYDAIQNQKLLIKNNKNNNFYSLEEDAFILQNLTRLSLEELGTKLNRSSVSIHQRLRILGVSKRQNKKLDLKNNETIIQTKIAKKHISFELSQELYDAIKLAAKQNTNGNTSKYIINILSQKLINY